MSWFNDEQALFSWAGPGFGYPFDDASFTADLHLDELSSFALTSDTSELLAFGQFYARLGKCHMARLVVSPHHRGQGLAAELLRLLCERGSRELGTEGFSLFVLEDNAAAIAAYRKFGFEIARYPETMPADNCVYMAKW